MKINEWFEKNRFKATSFSNIKRLLGLKKEKGVTISLCIPTMNEAETIGKVIDVIKPKLMDKYGLLDEIIVLDGGSTDATKEIVEKKGVKFFYDYEILKRYRTVGGKGDALWKALYVSKGDIIVYVDADIKNIHTRFVYGLVGPLLSNDKIGFVKAFYRRPIKVGGQIMPLGGGRVTELLIRPLFNMYFPRLSAFIQPLSGEYAGRREILEKVSFFTGYGVETGLLIDINKKFGLKSMAQANLKKRVHRNQSLASLSNMSFGILQVFAKRANTLGKLIQVKNIRRSYKVIERYSDENNKMDYQIKPKIIKEKQRPPMITISEYRKKFKKEADPVWETYNMQKIVYTDLDGTLINHHTYSYEDSLEAINLLKKNKVPIVICTSKTRVEIERFREELNITDPFISENGGAIFIPKDYFNFDFNYDKETPEYKIIELGTSINFLLKSLDKIKKKGYKIVNFSGMSAEELSKDSGLDLEAAKGAKMREYDEAFKIEDESQKDEILELIEKEGYNYTAGGRYYHLLRGNDKGKAVLLLKDLFRKKYAEEEKNIKTIGLGDGLNDIPMLGAVDIPILVKNPAHPKIAINFNVKRTRLVGPKGWNKAIKELF